jgi:hypothetical protein
MKSHFIATAALILSASLMRGEDVVAQRWSALLNSQPFHVGDTIHKDMQHPKPDAARFTATLDLPDSVPTGFGRTFRVEIDVTHLISWGDRKYRKGMHEGQLLTRLFVNGKEQAVLNKFAHLRQSPDNVNKITVDIPGETFQPGKNQIEIIPGGARNDYDDFELQRVAVSTLRTPK